MTKKICIVENDKPVAEGKEHITLCGTDVKVELKKERENYDSFENCTNCLTKHRTKNRPNTGRFSAQVVVTATM